MKEMRGCILVIAFLWVASAMAQPELEYKRLVAGFPGVPVVTIKKNENVNVDIINGGLSITSEIYSERMYMDNRAGLYSEQSVNYSNFHEIVKIEAASLIPKKNKYETLKIKQFKTSDNLSKSVFYDGTQNISFFYPSLQPRTKTYLKYWEQVTQPRFISSFFFQGYAPTVEAEYSITASNDVVIDWKIFNMNDSAITFFKVSGKNNKTTYTWKAKNIGKYESDVDAPSYRYSMPHIVAWIKFYKVNGEEIPILGNTKDLYDWYYSITKDVNKEHDKELQSIVDSLIADVPGELEKVKKIYYWVQDHIKYIAIEDGMGGFVPRSAKAVCEKRYGDCKDMANIIKTMLSYAGIPCHLTWIGSRDIPYNYSDLSTPAVDNHMIATYINKDDYYFLDATGQYTPYNLPTSFIQGKEALIGIDSSRFEIKQVPVISYLQSQAIDTVLLEITADKITGTGSSHYSGYYDIFMSEQLAGNTTKDPAKTLRNYYSKGSNKFLLDSVKLGDLHNRDEALKIEYYFNVRDYVKHNADELYINLHLNKIFQSEEVKKERKLDIEEDFNGLAINVIRLKIPDGYELSHIPINSSFTDNRFGFDAEYFQKDNEVILTHKIYSNILILKKTDFEDWNKMIKDLQKTYSEVVILKKI